MCCKDGETYSGDQSLDGLKGIGASVDDVDLEAVLLETSPGSVDTLGRCGLGEVVADQVGDLGIRLGQASKGLGEVGVLRVVGHI